MLAPRVLKRDDATQRIVDGLVGSGTAPIAHEIASRERRLAQSRANRHGTH
jgi:hypothetical protein